MDAFARLHGVGTLWAWDWTFFSVQEKHGVCGSSEQHQVEDKSYRHSHSHNHLSCHLLELPGILHRQVVPTLLDLLGPRATGGGPQHDGGPREMGIPANQALGAVATAEHWPH